MDMHARGRGEPVSECGRSVRGGRVYRRVYHDPDRNHVVDTANSHPVADRVAQHVPQAVAVLSCCDGLLDPGPGRMDGCSWRVVGGVHFLLCFGHGVGFCHCQNVIKYYNII